MQLCRTMGDDDGVDEHVYRLDWDHPTPPSVAAVKQMLRPFLSGAEIFRACFPMFTEGLPVCTTQHTEIGTRFCALFRQLGDLAAKVDRAGDEFLSIVEALKAARPSETKPS